MFQWFKDIKLCGAEAEARPNLESRISIGVTDSEHRAVERRTEHVQSYYYSNGKEKEGRRQAIYGIHFPRRLHPQDRQYRLSLPQPNYSLFLGGGPTNGPLLKRFFILLPRAMCRMRSE